jgi:hypothetical protein
MHIFTTESPAFGVIYPLMATRKAIRVLGQKLLSVPSEPLW